MGVTGPGPAPQLGHPRQESSSRQPPGEPARFWVFVGFAEADPGAGRSALVRARSWYEKLRITGNSVPSHGEASQTGGTGKSRLLRVLRWRFGAGSGWWCKWHLSVSQLLATTMELARGCGAVPHLLPLWGGLLLLGCGTPPASPERLWTALGRHVGEGILSPRVFCCFWWGGRQRPAQAEDVRLQQVPVAVSPREVPVPPPCARGDVVLVRRRCLCVPLPAGSAVNNASCQRAGPSGTEEMRGCPRNGVRQERRQWRRLEMERGAGRQRLSAGHGRGIAGSPRPGNTRPPRRQHRGGVGRGGLGAGTTRAGPSARLEGTLLTQRLVWRKYERFGSWLGYRASELPPDRCPGLQPAGLRGSQCYPLITNANYTIIRAVILSIAAAGLGTGMEGNQSSAKHTWCGWGGRRGRAVSACAHRTARYFSFLPSLMRNLGFVATVTLPHVFSPLVFPVPFPRAVHSASPGPLLGFQHAASL